MNFREAIGFLTRGHVLVGENGKMFMLDAGALMSKFLDDEEWEPALLTVVDLNSKYIHHVDQPTKSKVRLFLHRYNGEGKWVEEGAQLLNENSWEPTDWVHDIEVHKVV
jgi:hypothetical protein